MTLDSVKFCGRSDFWLSLGGILVVGSSFRVRNLPQYLDPAPRNLERSAFPTMLDPLKHIRTKRTVTEQEDI